MSSAEDGYCSSDSPRAESPEESQAAAGAADAESPRSGPKRERDLCDIPASPSSPLPRSPRHAILDRAPQPRSVGDERSREAEETLPPGPELSSGEEWRRKERRKERRSSWAETYQAAQSTSRASPSPFRSEPTCKPIHEPA